MRQESDIARVARLRGKNPANYAGEAVGVETVARTVGIERVRSLFIIPEDPRTEMLFYDALPKPSRMLIANAEVAISAMKFADLLDMGVNQGALISLVSQVIPLRVRDVVMRRYGPNHPQAQEAA